MIIVYQRPFDHPIAITNKMLIALEENQYILRNIACHLWEYISFKPHNEMKDTESTEVKVSTESQSKPKEPVKSREGLSRQSKVSIDFF